MITEIITAIETAFNQVVEFFEGFTGDSFGAIGELSSNFFGGEEAGEAATE